MLCSKVRQTSLPRFCGNSKKTKQYARKSFGYLQNNRN